MENEEIALIHAKKILKKYPKNKKKMLEVQEKLKQTEEQIVSAGGQRITGMPGAKGKITDLSDYMVLQETLHAKLRKTVMENLKVDAALAKMENDTYADLIKHRYLDEMCWIEVADIMEYSESHVKHMHRAALKAFSEQIALNSTK